MNGASINRMNRGRGKEDLRVGLTNSKEAIGSLAP